MNKIVEKSFLLPAAAMIVALMNYPITSQAMAEDASGPSTSSNTFASDNDHDAGLELFADLTGPMLRGLTMSSDGRMFVTFPRFDGATPYTVAELVSGKVVPYPDTEMNRVDLKNPAEHIISVMSAVVDNKDRLWIADSARVMMTPLQSATKLVGIDLKTNKVFKTISLPAGLTTKNSVLHDLRFDASKGKDGVIYISDSAPMGQSAIIVVDVATGKCQRRLSGHSSVQAEAEFIPFIQGRPMLRTTPDTVQGEYPVGVSGLAVKPNSNILYYCPQASRQLFSVDTSLLCDPTKSEFLVEQSVKNLGPKSGASDGLECDKDGNLYFTDFENSTVWRRTPKGTIEKVVHDTRLVWPDSLWIGADGFLYITSSQFNQLAQFNKGSDLRSKSYQIYRYKLASTQAK